MITTSHSDIARYREQGIWGDRKLHDLLTQTAKSKSREIALVDPLNKYDLTGAQPLRLSYADLMDKVDRLALSLLHSDIGKNDILLVQMPNITELVLVYLAASKLGAIVSPIPMQYQEYELQRILNVLQPKAVITVATFKQQDFTRHILDAVKSASSELKTSPEVFTFFDGKSTTDLSEMMQQVDTLQPLEAYIKEVDITADQVFTICWTSGTEGAPKGIPRSHNQWLTVGLATYEGNQIEDGEALLNPFPFINMASIGGLFLSWLYSGGKLVLHHPLDLPLFLRQIVSEKISYTLAPPALLNNILKNEALLAQCDFSGIRAIGSGSAPLDTWMVEGFKERFDIEIVNHFGSNEGVCLLCGPNETTSSEKRAQLFPRAHKFLQTRIVDRTSGEIIEQPGIQGELQIKGPSVFDGYYGADRLTDEAFTPDGYYRTGDLFEISQYDQAFYHFRGRCKDLIIRGGVNISPAELDTLINAHQDIVEAAVAPYPCDIMGERVAAFVVTHPGKEITLAQLVSFMKQSKIATFKLPEKIIQLEAIPRNPLGKVERHKLADFLT